MEGRQVKEAVVASSAGGFCELTQTVRSTLSRNSHCSIQNLQVSVENGHVTLMGRVTRYYAKQMAQTVLMCLPGVRGLTNNLEVVPDHGTPPRIRPAYSGRPC